MSREVSPELSAHIAALLLRAKPRFKSQNAMAKEIGLPGGTISNIVTETKGVGLDVLPKLLAFFEKTREQLEAEADAAAPARTVVSAREETRLGSNGKLSRVRDSLYKRHSKEVVDSVIMGSDFIDGVDDEIEAIDTLEALIRGARHEEKTGEIVGRAPSKPHDPTKPPLRGGKR